MVLEIKLGKKGKEIIKKKERKVCKWEEIKDEKKSKKRRRKKLLCWDSHGFGGILSEVERGL